LRQLIQLPWRLVLCESRKGALAKAMEENTGDLQRFIRRRGFVHLAASDPEGLRFPPQALPVFMLNGRDDSNVPEEAAVSGRGAMRRRLNMVHQLTLATPPILVALSDGSEQPLEEIFQLWQEEGFRAQLLVVSV